MSDLNPKGTVVVINGQEYHLLLTINKIDEIQARCNMPLHDVIGVVAEAAGENTDTEVMKTFSTVLSVLLSTSEHEVTEEDIRERVEFREYGSTAWAILAAYGISMPESDEEDEDEDEEHPNQKTGQ